MPIERFERVMGYTPDLTNPKGYNEKVLCRKLYDRRQILVDLTDKKKSKGLVDIECIPTIGEGLDYKPKSYPFIAKPNNWSGKTLLIRDSNEWLKAKEIYRGIQGQKYGVEKGEWAYSLIPFTLMIEPVLTLHEVKLYCFDGKCELIRYMPPRKQFITHPPEKEGMSHFLPDGAFVKVSTTKYPIGVRQLPDWDWQYIISEGERISKGLDAVRTDLYYNGSLYFGEFTFYPGSGHTKWSDPEFDTWLGAFWNINVK